MTESFLPNVTICFHRGTQVPHEQCQTRGSHTASHHFLVMMPSWLQAAGSRNFVNCCPSLGASLVDQLVKNPTAMQETWVPFLGWEDTLEKGTATHSSILPWRIPQTV